ncbi:MAG: amino acid permease [Atopobiaceae bacterium]|nr:amino acid permease [Atopobiaceae bacterium]
MRNTANKTEGLSLLNVWSLSFGCALGWGAFVMPGSTLLPLAGPLGTIIALLLGALAMGIIAMCLQFMAVRNPEADGAFGYTLNVFGHDHAFFCAWALMFSYVAIMWANATAIVLLARFILGPVYQFGFHYVVAGYDVYAGEIFVTLTALILSGTICWIPGRSIAKLYTALAVIFLVGTIVCFTFVAMHQPNLEASFSPPLTIGRTPGYQVFSVFALAPWAFVGFEVASQYTRSFRFPVKRLLAVLMGGLGAGLLVYVLTTGISVMATPRTYVSWYSYIRSLSSFDGLISLPVFHGVETAMGRQGILMLSIVVLCAIFTSLIGLYRTTGRLLCTMAEKAMLPDWFAAKSNSGIPRNAVLFIMLISLVAPFVGRAAIGWVVDVTSVSASIIYAIVCACVIVISHRERNWIAMAMGILGVGISLIFFAYPLLSNLWGMSTLAAESYFFIAAWSMLGLVLYRLVFQNDTRDRFGKSTITWIAMLFLVFFSSTMWVRQSTQEAARQIVDNVSDYYDSAFTRHGVRMSHDEFHDERVFLSGESEAIESTLLSNSFIQMLLVAMSLGVMLSIYSLMRHREREHELRRMAAEESSKAKTMFLSNMSHDIRTPMNAIIGYTTIAQREGTTPEEMTEYLKKIDASSKHLLALINDVLEMSRIESGKMDLDVHPCDLRVTMHEVEDMFATQMMEKGITFAVDTSDVEDPYVQCDNYRLNRVLLNLLSNAYKFTPEGGSVTVTLTQLANDVIRRLDDDMSDEHPAAATEADAADYRIFELRVRDTGIGMSPEFAAHVFEAFEREHTSTINQIQGTGLGMAITKSIVELMGGTIEVHTRQGEGTEFVIRLNFELADSSEYAQDETTEAESTDEIDFTGKRALLVEDNEINLEIASIMLEELGFEYETAINGKEALDALAASEPGYFDVVVTDIQMPVMDGYEEAKAIRRLSNPELASIPIVACSANVFAEDVQAAKNVGMNGYLSKPLEMAQIIEVLGPLLA